MCTSVYTESSDHHLSQRKKDRTRKCYIHVRVDMSLTGFSKNLKTGGETWCTQNGTRSRCLKIGPNGLFLIRHMKHPFTFLLESISCLLQENC